jgi:predicted ATPase/DNA-binding SARP family transcriptional activator
MVENPPTEFAPTPHADLAVSVLGVPVVKWLDAPLDIARRQVRALLYRLAAGPESIPREQLCFLFWPDVPETDARRKLTGLLAHLRRSLPETDLVIASGDHVGLAPDRTASDLGLFRGLLSKQDSAQALEALREAVDLYRGPFLDGFSLPDNPEYETWATVERQHCERGYVEALETLVEEYTRRGDYALAITFGQRYIEADELAESMHRRLIQLYTAMRARSAAIHQFEQCSAALERELDVKPLPETQAAYEAALADRSADSVVDLAAPAATTDPVWTTLPGLDVALVGREDMLDGMQKAYERAKVGEVQVILISGEAGIGKSRLIEEFAAKLAGQVQVLAATAHRDAQASPFQPLVEALRPSLLAHHASRDVPDWCLAEAARLMPELRRLRPDLPLPLLGSGEQARTRLFEALDALVLGLALHNQPVLLCLDDLQWADGTTLDWLAYTGRRLSTAGLPATEARAGLLIVGTYWDQKASAMAQLRRSLQRSGVLAEMPLMGLDERAVGEVLRQLESKIPYDDDLARRLRRLTGGNPFFLLETLRAIVEAGCELEDLLSSGELCLPDTVLDAVQARMASLSSAARQVVEAGAVLGRSFALELVRATSGRDELEAVSALDELVARDLLEEGTTGYWFHHEILREAVYRQLSRGRRQVLHRRAAEALERLEPDNASSIAWHFERADEPGRAARHSLRAGRSAQSVFAHIEARSHFDRALELLQWEAVDLSNDTDLAANRRLQIEALQGRSWALRLVGDMHAYSRDLEAVVRLADALGDARTKAHLCWREAHAHRWFCRYAEARASAEEGVGLSQEAGDPLLEALCLREVGLAARATGDYDQAGAVLELALRRFVEHGETVYEIHTMGNLATLRWYENAYEAALDLARRALERCEEAGLSLERRLPLGDMGAAALALHATELATQCLEESLAIARQISDRTQEILCSTHLGWLSIRIKRPGEALEYFRAALALAQRVGSCAEQSWLHSGLAEAHRLAGHREAALAHANQARELAQETGATYDDKLAGWVLDRLDRA